MDPHLTLKTRPWAVEMPVISCPVVDGLRLIYHPITSMGLVYLPAFTIEINQLEVYISYMMDAMGMVENRQITFNEQMPNNNK